MAERGAVWVIGQFLIGFAIIVAAPLTRLEIPFVARLVGLGLMGVGGLVVFLGVVALGPSFSVFPKPNRGAHDLVTWGVYRIVRHPIYSGVLVGAVGWSIFWGSPIALVLTVVLFVWLDRKAHREESWLTGIYPDYSAYQSSVKKLIPLIY
jgi:protein-S-isoprenylcysteine O-methyltransferase Ste14